MYSLILLVNHLLVSLLCVSLDLHRHTTLNLHTTGASPRGACKSRPCALKASRTMAGTSLAWDDELQIQEPAILKHSSSLARWLVGGLSSQPVASLAIRQGVLEGRSCSKVGKRGANDAQRISLTPYTVLGARIVTNINQHKNKK